ncbi:Uncharacterised protein [Mycobacteroides abscessus subsp. abscessus]|nr:Uncharacterised protein [Mycobacteroides abscessus subsp. abscessus]
MCARGVLAVQRYLVIMMLSMPSSLSISDAAAPDGPDPTTSTSVSTTWPVGISVWAMPSSNAGIGGHLSTTGPAGRLRCLSLVSREALARDELW